MAEKEVTIKVSTETDISNMEDLTNILDDASGKAQQLGEELQSAFEEASSEVEALEQELADIEMGEIDGDFDAVLESLSDATDRANELEEALNEMDTSGINNSSSDADDLADSLSDATENANELSDSMGLIESTMLMDMATQIGGLGDQAEGMAQDMNQASISVGQLATNVGIAEPKMVSLINYISNKTFPQEEAMAYVNVLNQMGVSADKLGDSATNMDRINDATGMGYNKVMLLTQGLVAVGVSADNLPSAFNAIAYAEANVGGGAETLQTVLKRQAGTLNEYGMGVDATVVALSALQRQTGLTGMKLGSEFGSRLKDCNGDIGQLEQSLGLANGTLQNANQITGEYDGTLQQLADEEMEHKTFIDDINAGWEDMQLALSPLLSPLMSVAGIIGGFGQFALAVNSILTLAETFGILETATISETIAQWGLNLSFLASPITWIVIAIIVLIGVLIYLYYNNEQVREAVDNLGQTFVQVGQIMYTAMVDTINWIISALQGLWNYIITLGGLLPANVDITGNKIIDTILRVMGFVATLPFQMGMIFVNTIAKVLGFGDNFTQRMITAGANAINGFLSYIKQLPSIVMGEFNRVLGLVNDFINSIPSRVWDMGVAIIDALKASLGIHSPGFMFHLIEGEFQRIDTLTQRTDFNDNIKNIGKGMVDNFNPELTMGNVNLTGAVAEKNLVSDGDFIINIYGDVDNDRRIQQIVDAVRRELRWNNTTAGRTV